MGTATSGCDSRRSSKVHFDSAKVLRPVGPATTSAERGAPSMSDSSPKYCPGPSVVTSTPLTSTRALPSSTTCISTPLRAKAL